MVRMKRQLWFSVVLAAVALLVGARVSQALPITFEGLQDGTPVTTQYAADHVTFSNATAIVAGVSLNEFEFPPHSGTTVVFDDGGPMRLSFSVPFTSVQGFFTYGTQLTLTAFSDTAGLHQIGSVSSLFNSNDALFGDPGSNPNELLQLAGIGPIGSIQITGDPSGGSFTLDDFNGTPTPEPASLLLLGSGLGGLWWRRKMRKVSCCHGPTAT